MITDVLGRFFPMTGFKGSEEPVPHPLWFLNVGVGSGKEAWELKSHWPEIEVLGFEPSRSRFGDAVARCYPGRIYDHGAWSHARTHKLSREGDSSSVFSGRVYEGTVPEDVELRPLDEQLNRGVRDAILWLDIEGAELEALRGAWGLLKESVLLLNVEVRSVPKLPGACSEGEVDSFLAAFGFCKALTYNAHTFPDPHHDAVYVHSSVQRTW